MKKRPLVSLIVPCYNVADICDRFFASLLNQTYTHIQLILINDGSTDNTERKVLSFQNELEGKGYLFEYYYQPNKGLGGAINTGLKKIKGELFCWADSDDFYEDNAFEVRVNYFIKHPECMVLTCDANIRKASDLSVVTSHVCDRNKYHHEPKQFKHLLDYESLFCSGAHMIRTSAFRQCNPFMDIYEARRGQNWQLLLPMYYFFDRHVLPDVVYNYIVYSNSMSHSDTGYEDKINRINENQTIQIETLKRIKMPITERNEYINHVILFHDKLKMYVARDFGEKDDYISIYKSLKDVNEIDIKDRLRRMAFLLSGK